MDSRKLDLFYEPKRREIINGKIYMMAGTSTKHNYVLRNLTLIFGNYLKGRKCTLFTENEKVIFSKDENEVLPDLKIVCDPNKIKEKHIEGAPDLIIEISSPRTMRKDETEKKKLYEKYGVQEYWLVYPENRSVRVYILKDGEYPEYGESYIYFDEYDIEDIEKTGTEEEKEMLKVKSIETSLYGGDLIINIDEIFEDVI